MNITTRALSADDLRDIARTVGAYSYHSNLTVEVEQRTANTYRFKLGADDSRGRGARTAWSGRHGPWACWHAFRDVFAAILLRDPNATIRTRMATYKGAAGFLSDFPGTADQNIGSMVQPAYMDELCGCADITEPYVAELARSTR